MNEQLNDKKPISKKSWENSELPFDFQLSVHKIIKKIVK